MTDQVRVGLNLYCDVVLFCEKCAETFAKKVQDKTLSELAEMAKEHKCTLGVVSP